MDEVTETTSTVLVARRIPKLHMIMVDHSWWRVLSFFNQLELHQSDDSKFRNCFTYSTYSTIQVHYYCKICKRSNAQTPIIVERMYIGYSGKLNVQSRSIPSIISTMMTAGRATSLTRIDNSKKESECSVEERFDPDDPAHKYHHDCTRATKDFARPEWTVSSLIPPSILGQRPIAPFLKKRFALIIVSSFVGLGIGLSLCGLTPAQKLLLLPLFQNRASNLVKRLVVDDARRIHSASTLDRRRKRRKDFVFHENKFDDTFTTEFLPSTNTICSVDTPLSEQLQQLDNDVVNNADGGWRFLRPCLLPALNPTVDNDTQQCGPYSYPSSNAKDFVEVKRRHAIMQWEVEWQELLDRDPLAEDRGPVVDYTTSIQYTYPNQSAFDDQLPSADVYPPLRPLSELLLVWDPAGDFSGTSMHEALVHFDYRSPREMALARRFRDSELPFKVIHIPELLAAGSKWSDEYVAQQFARPAVTVKDEHGKVLPTLTAAAHESANHFFCFYTSNKWNVSHFGLPPTRINDWDYTRWAQHAQYAQATHLSPHKPHFYWQSGVHALERHRVHPSNRSFIARDLPSFSSPNATFFVFRPNEQKGIQCRFGERGIYAASHYDGGRNMVAVIQGAKRYILSPPRECSKLGVWPSKTSPLYRHSSLNYAHYSLLSNPDASAAMSEAEKAWLRRAGQSHAVETVLKPGEVLYIPSHWFHTVISLQKSVQCNVRAVRHTDSVRIVPYYCSPLMCRLFASGDR